MKAKLSYSVINASLKQSFVVMIDDVFYKNRTRIQKDTTMVELSCLEHEDKLSDKYKHTAFACIEVPIEIAQANVVKFIATYKSNDKWIDMSISHESTSNLIESLESYSDSYDKLRNKEEIIIDGKVTYINTLPTINDICVITDINIIDKYKLYNIADRQAKVTRIDKYNLQVELINNKERIDCKREQFKLLKVDKFYLFSLYCLYCKR